MNRLADEPSPYLRQHADNPVDWWTWCPEALQAAAARNVPIHLSVGYAACHWCHVMARESFSDPATAELLNRFFVNIKVDREERPDIDQIYMKALHATGEQGGWPLTMFLSPEGEPFWGGTYFPPEPRWGRPSFRQVAAAVYEAWRSGDEAVAQNRRAILRHLQAAKTAEPAVLGPDLLERAAATLLSVWDPIRGSFRGAPKFPNAPALEALWRAAVRSGRPAYREAVLTTLTHLCQGGIYDHVGGGFARYAVDAEWKVPHFEKMLYDNGQLLAALARAVSFADSPLFRRRIEETVGWLQREMTLAGGAFAASLDADTEHEEGRTYVWSKAEIDAVLGAEDGAIFCRFYDVTAEGNWEGHNVLNRLAPHARAWLGDDTEARLAELRGKLLAVRDRRPQPGRDDKVLADWNGIAIQGLVAASRACDRPDWLAAAESAFRFVAGTMQRDGRLGHAWGLGRLVFPGMATDHAQMIAAALALYGETGAADCLALAEAWFAALERHYLDAEAGTYFMTADDAETLVVRPHSDSDEAVPAANGVMVHNAVMLAALTGKEPYRARAAAILERLGGRIGTDVVGSASLQAGYDTALRLRLISVVGEDAAAEELVRLARREGDPAAMLLAGKGVGLPPAVPPQSAGGAALFVCDASRCLPPASGPDAAARLLAQSRAGLAAA